MQRTQNGIPGNLQDVAELSLGCWQYENLYQYDFSQYPHEEVQGQKGYTKLGNQAASMSDLAMGFGMDATWGTRTFQNAWGDAPLHLAQLYDPSKRYAWFGAAPGGECMGTAGFDPTVHTETETEAGQGPPPTPAFYSVPGDRVAGVPPAEVAAESPFTPQQAIHMSASRPTGPNILLYVEDVVDPQLADITLYDPHGSQVKVAVIGPSTPVPPLPSGWPKVATMVDYALNTWFVIPTHPLAGRARYKLVADWSVDGSSYRQTAQFTTSCKPLVDPMTMPPSIHGCRRRR